MLQFAGDESQGQIKDKKFDNSHKRAQTTGSRNDNRGQDHAPFNLESTAQPSILSYQLRSAFPQEKVGLAYSSYKQWCVF